MTLLLSFLLGTASAADRSRMRSFYQYACQTNLAVPRGLKIVTGAMLNKTATEPEFEMAARRLSTRVRTEALNHHDFAAYLYALAVDNGSWHQGEDLFFAYLQRPGNQLLAGRLLSEMLVILKSNLLYADAVEPSIAARLRLVIEVSRLAPERAVAPWIEFIDDLLMGEERPLGLAAAGLLPLKTSPPIGPDAQALFGEFERAPAGLVSGLGWGEVPTFISILRLDRWVRAAAALPGPDRLTKIRENLFELSRSCTKH